MSVLGIFAVLVGLYLYVLPTFLAVFFSEKIGINAGSFLFRRIGKVTAFIGSAATYFISAFILSFIMSAFAGSILRAFAMGMENTFSAAVFMVTFFGVSLAIPILLTTAAIWVGGFYFLFKKMLFVTRPSD